MCDIELKSAGTNTRFAPGRDAPRRPCCSLCSARARSGLCTTDPRGTSVGIWLGRSATSSGPCSPSFGIAPSPVADSQPKRQAPTRDWSPGRRIESAHPLQRMDPNCVGAVASSAREVRRAMMCRSREAQYAHWQNQSVLRASIIWLAHAVNVVRPFALRLHIDCVRFARRDGA